MLLSAMMSTREPLHLGHVVRFTAGILLLLALPLGMPLPSRIDPSVHLHNPVHQHQAHLDLRGEDASRVDNTLD